MSKVILDFLLNYPFIYDYFLSSYLFVYHFTNPNDWFKDFSKISQLIFHSLDVTWLHSEGGKGLYVLCGERQNSTVMMNFSGRRARFVNK